MFPQVKTLFLLSQKHCAIVHCKGLKHSSCHTNDDLFKSFKPVHSELVQTLYSSIKKRWISETCSLHGNREFPGKSKDRCHRRQVHKVKINFGRSFAVKCLLKNRFHKLSSFSWQGPIGFEKNLGLKAFFLQLNFKMICKFILE